MSKLVHLVREEEDDYHIQTLCGKYRTNYYDDLNGPPTKWESIHYTWVLGRENPSREVKKLCKPPNKFCKKCYELLPVYALRD